MEIDNISFNDLVVSPKDRDDSYEDFLERIISRLKIETIERLVKEFHSIKRKKGEHYLVYDFLRDQYLVANKSYWYEYVHYYDKEKLGDDLEELIKEKYLDKTVIRGIIYSSDIETLNYLRERFEPKEDDKLSGTFHFVFDTILSAFDLINANKIRKITARDDDNFNFSDIKFDVIGDYSKDSYKYLFSTLKTEKLITLMQQIGSEKEGTYGIYWLVDAIGNEIFRRQPERVFGYLDKENFSYEDFLEYESSCVPNGTSFRQIVLAHYLNKETLEEFLDILKKDKPLLINRPKIYLLEKILHKYDDKTLTGKRFDLLDETICFEDLLLNGKLEECINKVIQIYDFLKFLPNELLEPLFDEALKNQFSPDRERRLLANRIFAEYIRRNPTAEKDGNLTHPFLNDIKVDDLLYDMDSFDFTSYCMVRYKLIDYLDHIQISKLLEELDIREENNDIEDFSCKMLKQKLNEKLQYINKLYVTEHEGEITFNNLVVDNPKTSKFTIYDQDHIIAALTTEKIERMLDESRLIEIKSDAEKELISKLHAEYRLRNFDVYKSSYMNRAYFTIWDLALDKNRFDKFNYKDQVNMYKAIKILDPNFDFSHLYYLKEEQREQLSLVITKDEYSYENHGFKRDLFILHKLKTCTVSDIVNSEVYDYIGLVAKFNTRKINKLLKEIDSISKERELTHSEDLLKHLLEYEQKERKEDNQSGYQYIHDDEFKKDKFNIDIYIRDRMSVPEAIFLDIKYLAFLEKNIDESLKGKKKKQRLSNFDLRRDYLLMHSLLNKSVDGPFDYYLYPYILWKEQLVAEPLDYFMMHKKYLNVIKENKEPSSIFDEANI